MVQLGCRRSNLTPVLASAYKIAALPCSLIIFVQVPLSTAFVSLTYDLVLMNMKVLLLSVQSVQSLSS